MTAARTVYDRDFTADPALTAWGRDTRPPLERAMALVDRFLSGDPWVERDIAHTLAAHGLVPDEVAWNDAVEAERALRDLRDSGINTADQRYDEARQEVHLQDALATLVRGMT